MAVGSIGEGDKIWSLDTCPFLPFMFFLSFGIFSKLFYLSRSQFLSHKIGIIRNAPNVVMINVYENALYKELSSV